MELSKRLQAVADLASKGGIVADVGTDHGYIPIHLIQSGKCSKVYAMDINEGPYLRAKQHVSGYGLSSQIITRQSDGMKALEKGEVTSVIIAGMGGALVIKILEQDRRLWEELEEIVLQPQSELDKVRTYLWENEWKVVQEEMIYEDGKYYPMMRVVRAKDEAYSKAELLYGRCLIASKHPVLEQYIRREIEMKEKVKEKVMAQRKEKILHSHSNEEHSHIEARIQDLEIELEVAYEVQRYLTTD